MKLSMLREVSRATPTTISRLVPPSWMGRPVTLSQQNGQHGDHAQEQGAHQGDLAQYLGDEIAGRLAGTVAGDRAVVLAQIVGDLNRVVLDGPRRSS